VISYAVDAGDAGIAVGCVLRVGPRQSSSSCVRDEVCVSRVEQLDSTLTLAVNEELVSNIISVTLAASSSTQVSRPRLHRTR